MLEEYGAKSMGSKSTGCPCDPLVIGQLIALDHESNGMGLRSLRIAAGDD